MGISCKDDVIIDTALNEDLGLPNMNVIVL